ncbi:auxin transport protein BIG [Typha latifolia]|uniref:auxin transport protein BIG n=1 Tax=Typha latifolia TaxID=4733 RepID=UPI003C2B088F
MAEISGLLEIFQEEKAPKDLPRRLRSDAIRPGLERLLAVLDAGIADAADGRLGFESWSRAQIDAVVAVAKMVVSAVLSTAVEQVEAVVVAIVEKSLEFGIRCLEKSRYDGDDFGLQNGLAQFLELALTSGTSKECDMSEHTPVNTYIEQLSSIPVKPGNMDLGNSTCYLEGFNCLKAANSAERLMITLSSECLEPVPNANHLSKFLPTASMDFMLSLAQYFAVVHLKCVPHLLMLCKELLQLPVSLEEQSEDGNFGLRLSFSQRILKFLHCLVSEYPYDASWTDLLIFASYADTLPALFRLRFDISNHDWTTVGDKFGNLSLQIMEEFLQLIQSVFYDSDICCSIQTCIIASMMETLSSKVWRYDTSSSSLMPPLIYCPQIVIYLVKHLRDVKSLISRSDLLKEKSGVDTPHYVNKSEACVPLCHVRSETVFLLKKYTSEEYLRLIFPQSEQWLDDLVHVAFFLHEEGVRSKPVVDKSRTTSSKTVISDSECAASHDDEAIFGDLFAEAGRPVGSGEGLDQSVPLVASALNTPGLPIQAATDILNFLKLCIFSPEWNHSVFEDACRKLSVEHVNQLLSIVNCQSCLSGERNFEKSATSQVHVSFVQINDICFQILHTLLVRHDLSPFLRKHLVDQVLKVENGFHVYNYYTLTLVAHALISAADSDTELRMKIFMGYFNFVAEKAKSTLCDTEPTDFIETLPCAFHLEILLMAFHLSSVAEKAALANFVFSSIRNLDAPPPGVSAGQLCSWGLLMSRLLLILRHMISYPSTCPSWLLLRLRSKLRESPFRALHFDSLNDQLPSFASSVVASIFGDSLKESSVVSSLIPQLIDVSPLITVIYKDDSALQNLGLNFSDLFAKFSQILGFWRGKEAEAVEHLVIERYIFLLCWGTVSGASFTTCDLLQVVSWVNIDLSDVELLFRFCLTLVDIRAATFKNIDFPAVICGLLQQLHSEQSLDMTRVKSWDFLRKGTWFSLILSLLNAGIWGYSVRSATSGVVPYWGEQDKDGELVNLVESVIMYISAEKKGGWLLNVLLSTLKAYLHILDGAFLSVLDPSRSSTNHFSPLLLLKHVGFDKPKQDFLREKSGCNMSQLEVVYDLSLKLDGITSEVVKGNIDCIFLRCLLHGFPSHSDSSNGALLSCILVIRDVICTLDGYLKIRGDKDQIDAEVFCQLMETVMAIKSDKIFRCISEQCDSIYDSLIGHRKNLAGYSELFVLKQLEGFLASINSKNDAASDVQEIVIASIVDLIEGLRRDNSKKEIFKFYLGSDEGLLEEEKILFGHQRANIPILIDALNKCNSEAINLKVLNLFIDLIDSDLCPGLKENIQKNFLEMELLCLSGWLEFRILGCSRNFIQGSSTATGSFPSLRESTVDYIMRLVLPSSETMSRELQSRLVEAMLMLLDSAFLLCDLHTGKAYFNFLVQLLDEETSMRQLLEKIVVLMEKLVDNENLLPGLKFLFSFLDSVLGDFGANVNVYDKLSSKLSLSSSFSSGSLFPKQLYSRKNSDNFVLPANQERGSASVDCEATSGDEDEDDGTSDGELGSIDRDDEEDSNSEKALASKVCTFTSSGSNFMEQHWYFCYTCDLTVSKGCCSICAKVCHRGHRVVYSRSSRFFCDCGAGGVRGSSCQCLKPRKFTGASSTQAPPTSSFQSILPYSEDGDQAADSDSDLDDDISADINNCFKLAIPHEVQDALPAILEKLDTEGQLLELCNKLLTTVIGRRESNLSKDKKILLGGNKLVSYNVDIFQLKKAYKSGSLDLKIKADYPNSRELKSQLANGTLTKSLLSVSVRGRLAAGEGDKVSIFDVGQLIGQPTVAPVTADKTNVKPLSRNIVRFEIVHLTFNPLVENYLAVAGYEECQVLTVNPRGEVTDRLAIELALQGAYIRRVEWVPGSQVRLMVVTNMFVKIYDLSQDNISPMHYFTLADDCIVDATLIPASMGKVFLIVLSEAGCLYRLEVSMEGDVGAKTLSELIRVKEADFQPKGLSLYFSSTYRLLFLSYQDGTTIIGRLDATVTSLTELSCVCEEDQDDKVRSAGLHHWKELIVGSGIFICLSSLKSNTALAVSLSPHDLAAQNMRYSAGSTSPMVGIASYKPLSKDKTHCLILQDDGSLQIYSYIPKGVDTAVNTSMEQTKRLGSSILSNRAYAGSNVEFPLDFFEKTMCITADVKLSSDASKSSDSEVIKQRLSSDEGYLESLSSTGFKVTVSNSNPDIVMVGCRIHVGNTSASHIPCEITIFQRIVKLDEGMRSWYDIPFTTAESLLADEEFTITVGRTFDGLTMPRIDSLEVYGRAKDEFGWKEKMDAVLDMEAHVLGTNSATGRLGKKSQTMHAAPIQEQVLADALKILSRIYLLCRSKSAAEIVDADMELGRLKCRALLETIFQSDKEPLLQSAACHVLKAVFPKREIYYHVKDTMRLLGVIKSFPMLTSRIGVGGAASGWVIKEFIAQLNAVSKIAVHRRSNMATFLETHGSGVVDGLMQVLWGILDLERPETQTINSIVIPSVELIYSYAECLALHANEASGQSVAPAVALLKKLLFSPFEAVQTSSSLAISSRLLQVPFPKQTMIATDDASENRATTNVPSDTNSTGGNAQVMIEEDPATSSVQYCCDGCSTVPILRQRWHCNVCPDFDLCEACYEVLDADHLPPPHSRDHPMSAIPIEIDSLGGDGNEIHYSVDEQNDSSVMHVAVDRSMQNSPSSIHVLETNETGDFPASATNQRIVSISASKRAVNSLLLRHLIEELNGWMDTTAGIRAIPVMQLFYRLSSAVGGPFVDSSKPENLDLEKFVRWLLDEINLNKPFSAKTRSSFGEVAILVFMFFTLMFRNWHQPGGDGSQSKSGATPDLQEKGFIQVQLAASAISSTIDDQEKNEFASQLIRACSFLRQQVFLNYLMDILQQLVYIFKSSSASTESSSLGGSSCSSLLTVRRELPAGNFSPFFSDSYAKAHRTDLFMDYHKLLLENTFRLVYSMVRPEKQDKSAEKDKIYKASVNDLKLDGFQDVLCSYISNPHTTFVRRYARRLFLHLCGSKTHYYSFRDSWQFSFEVKKLYKLVNKSGGFQKPVPYERSVKLVKCLCAISEVAGARPRNWQKFCLKHMDLLPFLMNGIFYFGEESVIQTLKLLNLAFYTGKEASHATQKSESKDEGGSSNRIGLQLLDPKKKRKGEDGNESGLEKSCLDMEQAVEMFNNKDASVWRSFIDSFLLEWNSASVRHEAKCVLHGIWYHGKISSKEAILSSLLQKVKFLPMYGQNIVEYMELMTGLLGKVADNSMKQYEKEVVNKCLTSDVISCIFETLHSQNELLANHPNSRIYNTLSGLVEFDGYYLESEPCVTCSCPDVPYARMKLESLKSETKFTDNRIIVKCTGSYTIQSVTMNVHDARKSKSVKVLNLYYNNRPVADLSELKNNWSLWKRAKSCHLAFNQTELKVEFPIPINACNLMIEMDSFYENLQASSLESLQCPRCSRSVTDKHGICGNCHENAYQCRQCRNINYENLDSFLCNECGYSKYGRFEFNFMAKPSFSFDNMENDEDMKKGLAAIESESENAHRRYQQLLGFKKPLLKLVSSIGENEIDAQQKDTVQQMMVSLPGPSCKVNRKIALLGVLYGEKCKAAFDSVSKSVQTLQGLRRVLMAYLHQKNSDDSVGSSAFAIPRLPNNCYGCATAFVTQCLELLQVLSKHANCRKQLVAAGILSELFENDIHQGPKTARILTRVVLSAFTEGDAEAVAELNNLIQKKVMYCLEHHRSIDIALATREELLLLTETCSIVDEFWESRLRVAFQLLFSSIKLGANHPSVSEHIILPCLRIISQACTPPRSDAADKEQNMGKSSSGLQSKSNDTTNQLATSNSLSSANKVPSELPEKNWDSSRKSQDIPLLSYSEWEGGASYLDFVRRQFKVSQAVKGTAQKSRQDSQKYDYLSLKYGLKWKRRACRRIAKSDFSTFALGSWVSELILSACSQSIRSEVCTLITLLCPQNSSRRFQLLNLLMSLLSATLSVGENAAEYFELFFRMADSEAARLFLTVRGCLATICKLITQEISNVESRERSLNIDISQGYILNKLVELLNKFLEVPNIRARFMRDELLSEVLEAFLVIRGLIVQKTKLISDCTRLLKDLLDSLLLESTENKRQFIRACISGLQNHAKEQKGRTSLFILEQLCNMISPSKPEPVYLLILNKAHTQEEFIRGSMTKNPYSSAEIGPLMRDVKNKICHQLDLLGLLEDDYGMELLVAGNIISLDLSISQVYEQVWKKYHGETQNPLSNAGAPPSSAALTSFRDCPPMTVTYRLQGLDGEATEPMIKELEEEREESQDPEVEFAIAGAVRECGGLEIILSMIQHLRDSELRLNQEELSSVLDLLMYCCKIRENRRALLRLGALGLLLETARRAFSVDAMELAEGILLIVESLTMEANESDISITQSVLTVTNEESGADEQAKKIVLMFLERLCHPSCVKKSNKQQRNDEMVARILPYLTYGEPAAMEALIQHFEPYLQDWGKFDMLQKQHQDNPKDDSLAQQAAKQRYALENFVRVSESLKTSSCGERLKDIILDKGITIVAVTHLKESFAVAGQAGFKNSAEWASGLKLPSVPLILSMLWGVSKGHYPTQRCIAEEGILPLLHALEGVSGENEIGARAENLLDTLANKENNGDGFLREKIEELRNATKDEMRRRALRKREALLQGLGMRQDFASDGGQRIVVSQPVIEGLEDVEEEEDGLACMVCREGYKLRPNDMLGIYSFSKRVNVGSINSGTGRGDCVYTTVSHFNIIHFQCHQEAKRADAALKNPKKEWEGATLRNNETLCNCIFPLRGPSVPLGQYVRYVDQYWDNLNALGRADGSRLRLLTYDIVLMLARFATGASFSTDSKGGGRESNSRFLPFMIQMASYLVDQGSSSQQRRSLAKSVAAYLSNGSSTTESIARSPSSLPGSRSATGPSEETVQFMMVNSLLSESYDDWLQHRPAFLQRGMYHAYMQHKHGRSSLRLPSDPASTVVRSDEGASTEMSDSKKLFALVQPMLVYTGLIEQLQRFFKLKKPSKAGGGEGSTNLEGWEIVMKERIVNMKEMVGFSRDMLSWLEDMTSAADLQEAFDVMGTLKDVFSGGFSQCEDFVREAIRAGKS